MKLFSLAVVLSVGVAGAGCGVAYADPGAPVASASASARPAYVPLTDQPAPPTDKSPAPSKSDWRDAPLAPEARVTDPGCEVKRLREWYRIECSDSHVSLIGGTREGVDVGRVEESYHAWIVFPARRGDVRVAEMSRRAKWGIAADVIISEQWLDGDSAPLLTVLGIPE